MSILDIFTIMFKADTSDLEKGQEKARKSTSDLQDKIKSTRNDTEGFGLTFVDFAEKAATALAAVVSVGSAIGSVIGSEQNALAVGRVANQIGMATEETDGLAQSMARYGASTGEALGNIQSLSEKLTPLTTYGGQSIPLPTALQLEAKRLFPGFDPKTTDVWKFFDQLHEQVKDLPPKISDARLQMLGLSNAEIRMLQDVNYYAVKKNSIAEGLLDAETTQKAIEFATKWHDIMQGIRNAGVSFGTPVIDFLLKLPALVQKNSEQFKDLKLAIAAASLVFIPFVVEMIIAAAPVYIFIAAIGLLYLAINKLGSTRILGWLHDIGDGFSWVADKIGKVLALMAIFGNRKLSWKDVWDQSKSILEDNSQEPSGALGAANKAINGAASSTIGSHTSSSIINNGQSSASKNVTVGSITIQTQATDAKGIASAVGEHINKYFNNGINNNTSSQLA